MAKTTTKYICQTCGFESLNWLGKCPNCNSWNTFAEEKTTVIKTQSIKTSTKNSLIPTALTKIETTNFATLLTGINEFDRVLGKGISIGSIILLGGDPGIGKSTLSLQVASALAKKGNIVLYISGEESPQQLRLRAERLNALNENIYLFSATNILDIEKACQDLKPRLVIIDSIQTIYHPELFSAPGSVGQVREASAYLIRFLKENNTPAIMIGHVTKEGSLAGPKILEHMVDTVLYFEGDRSQNFRIIRSIKNRFGSTNEIGIFDMRAEGLSEVKNPSELFIQDHSSKTPGTMIVPLLEGTRSFLVEVQALVSKSYLSLPRRTFTGIDSNRAAIIIAVLEKKCGLYLSSEDIFLNVVGGVTIDDPGADLGIALAIASSFKNLGFTQKLCAIGEIGLGGELRSVNNIEKRLNEAEKLGFEACILPKSCEKNIPNNLKIKTILKETLAETLSATF